MSDSASALHPSRRDWLTAGAVFVLQLLAPRTGRAEDADDPSAFVVAAVVVLLAGQSLPLAWRWTRPTAVAAVVVSCYAAYVALTGVVAPLGGWLAISTVALTVRERRRALVVTAAAAFTTCTAMVVAELLRDESGLAGVLVPLTLIVGLVAVLVRSERGRLEAARAFAAAEERLRIAADVHDLVGHGLSTVAVQSSTARLALDKGDVATARNAIAGAEATSRASMRDIRQWLDVLRDSASTAPSPGFADIPALIDNVRQAGVEVTADLAAAESASPTVQLCAYRIVQEALTNAMKHAPGSRINVATKATPGVLVVEVVSAGGRPPASTPDSGGLGLAGLRTRVAAVGGEMTATPTAEGWEIVARLPLERQDVT